MMLYIIENDDERKALKRNKTYRAIATTVFTVLSAGLAVVLIATLMDGRAPSDAVSSGFMLFMSGLWASKCYSEYRQSQRMLSEEVQTDEITALEKRLIRLVRGSNQSIPAEACSGPRYLWLRTG